MRSFLKSQTGFIFIDALVGMVILSVALTALAVAYRQTTITTVAAKDYNNAVYLAQQSAEELKKNDGQKVENANWTISGVKYTIKTPAPTNTELLKQVTINVSWPKNTTGINITSYYYLIP